MPAALHPAMFQKLSRAAFLAAATTFAAVVPAQGTPNPRPAPQWVLNALHVSQGTVQDLTLPLARQAATFEVVLEGRLVTIAIEPNDVRAPDFKLLVDDGQQLRQVETPPAATWIGTVVGRPESRVACTIVDGHLDGVVSLDRHDPAIWGIESVATMDPSRPSSEHVVYTTNHANHAGISCGADDSHWRPIGNPGEDVSMKLAEIAIDCDREFYQRNLSNVNVTQTAVTNIINGIDVIYQRDVEIQYQVTAIIVRTTTTYTGTDMGTLLNQFQSLWNSQHTNIRRDLAHMFTGKGSFSGVVGLAYVGVVCNTGSAYGVDKAFSNLGTNVGLVAHEAGHNWNAPHCDGSSPCNIMCSGLGGCSGNLSAFAPVSINVIVPFKNSIGCLSSPIVRPVITSITPGSIPVFPAQTITLNGTGFAGVSNVQVGGMTINPTSSTETRITFPSPLPAALGTFPVSVTNSAGTSNVVNLALNQVTPGFYAVQGISFSGSTVSLGIAGDPSDSWWVLAAFNSNTTFPFLGYNVLQNTLVLTQGQLSGAGVSQLSFQTPPNVSLAGVQMFSQAVLIDEVSPVLHWISPVQPTTFLF